MTCKLVIDKMTDDSIDNEHGAGSGDIPTEGEPPPQAILEIDYVYEAFGHSRRRYLCYSLLEDPEWSLDELARKIAAWENDDPEHAVTERTQEQVYVSLYHAHVPKLVDNGVISFDESDEEITPGENAEQVMEALEGMGASLDTNLESHARGGMDEGE